MIVCINRTLRLRCTPMSPRMARVFVCGILLLMFLTAAVLLSSTQVYIGNLSNTVHPRTSEEITYIKPKLLERLQAWQYGNQSDVKCVNATVEKLIFPMCIYDPRNDIYISKLVLDGKYFETDLVKKMLNFFRMHPDVTFVDLGANLGTYSLPIAHAGIHVVSVEPNKDTVRRLAKSVHLGRIEHNVDIFHYALSNEESTTFLKFNAMNRGDTFIAGNESCPACMSAEVTVLNKLIPFIKHRQVLMKIDTQEAEIKIFQRKSAAEFFDEIDVMMIQMEWVLYPRRFGKTEDGRRKVDRFLEFFYQRGYDVYDPRTEKKLDANWTKWTYDVLFKKDDLPKNQLLFLV